MPTENQPVKRSFKSLGLTLSFLDWVSATSGSTLLLLHGNRDHARSWDPVARALSAAYRVIALDLRGHGDSGWSPDGAYLSSYNLLDVVNLIDLLDTGPVSIVGHSFGGNLAARIAAAFPERVTCLALIDGFGPPPAAFAQWAEEGGVQRTRQWVEQHRVLSARKPKLLARIEEGADRLRSGNPRLPPDRAFDLAFHGMKREADGYTWKHDPLVAPFVPEDFSADNAERVWRDIICPTLLCYGAESWNIDPRKDGRAQQLQNCEIAEIANAGHWPHQEQAEAFLLAMREFLARALV